MTLPNDPLELAILLHREVRERQINGRLVEGVLPEPYDFQSVLDHLDTLNLRGPVDDPATRRFEFSLPANFYLSMESLLAADSRKTQAPNRFYVADLDYCYPADAATDQPEEIRLYLEATQLFQGLRLAADHEDRNGLIFLHQKKLQVTPEYTAEHLRSLSKLTHFEQEYISASIHKQQKATMLRTVLFDLFKGQERIPFSAVLARFDELVDQIDASYQLYISEFSFQKVKAEVEKEKLEFTTKLNKVFSDIQNQLLAVPAALILVGGQMESTGGWSIKNVLIWIGALVFALLMDLLINNQRHTLEAIKLEIEQQWELIEGKHKTVAKQFHKSYQQLGDRYHQQHLLLRTVSALVALALAFAAGMLLWYSTTKELALGKV